jgi:hypothetical protein
VVEPEPVVVRSITIDGARREQIVQDSIRMALRHGGHWWRYHAYRRAAESSGAGLDVGDSVSLTRSGDSLDITDRTTTIRLAKGTTPVRRFRSLVVVYSPELTFLLPSELLTVEDIEFLTGPGPDLPLHLEVTPQVQDAVVRRATGVVLRSADFLLGFVVTLSLTVFALATHLWGVLVVAGIMLVLSAPPVAKLVSLRRRYREFLPVGFTMRGAVTDEGLLVTQANGTVARPWRDYTALRVTPDAVLLRLRRKILARTLTQVWPRALFGPEELGRLATRVRRRF